MCVRKLSGPEREEVRREWRKLYKEKLYDLYALPNTITVVKSRSTKWERHVTRVTEVS
jgi:hypothetical protein